MAALLLTSGETIMPTTDGITESIEGVAARAEKARPTALLRKLSQAIYRGACDFEGRDLRDDVCLLLARLNQPDRNKGTGALGLINEETL